MFSDFNCLHWLPQTNIFVLSKTGVGKLRPLAFIIGHARDWENYLNHVTILTTIIWTCPLMPGRPLGGSFALFARTWWVELVAATTIVKCHQRLYLSCGLAHSAPDQTQLVAGRPALQLTQLLSFSMKWQRAKCQNYHILETEPHNHSQLSQAVVLLVPMISSTLQQTAKSDRTFGNWKVCEKWNVKQWQWFAKFQGLHRSYMLFSHLFFFKEGIMSP